MQQPTLEESIPHELTEYISTLTMGRFPQMLVKGDPVSKDDAEVIIMKTDQFLMNPPTGINFERCTRVSQTWKAIGFTESVPTSNALQLKSMIADWRRESEVLPLHCLFNNWVLSSSSSGPRGWCRPSGEIEFSSTLYLPSPSLPEIFSDWRVIAKEFPELRLDALFIADEGRGEQLIGFKIESGLVKIVAPNDPSLDAGPPRDCHSPELMTYEQWEESRSTWTHQELERFWSQEGISDTLNFNWQLSQLPPKGQALARSCPGKWPYVVTSGEDVTKEQALEIIRRTDYFFNHNFMPSSDFSTDALRSVGYPIRKKTHTVTRKFVEKVHQWSDDWGLIGLYYLGNDWVKTSSVCGTNGWCSPEGKIKSIRGVHAKWPSTECIFLEWSRVARAFPFISLRSALVNEDAIGILGFELKDGKVTLISGDDPSLEFIPSKPEHPSDLRDWSSLRQTWTVEEIYEMWGQRSSESGNHNKGSTEA